MIRSSDRTSPHAIKAAVVILAALVAAAAIYGVLSDRRARNITIDLSTSIDQRVVYPMDKDTVIITDPGPIDLRLPTGREYHRDGALEVWITRTREGDPNLIHEISINTLHDDVDEAHTHVYLFQELWGMQRGAAVDHWFEERRQRPAERDGVWPLFSQHDIRGVRVNGRAFSVGFDVRVSPFSGRYQVIEEFTWGGA